MVDPESGPVIAGTGGVRKPRWAAPGRGKRGGCRVIYYVRRPKGVVRTLLLVADRNPRVLLEVA